MPVHPHAHLPRENVFPRHGFRPLPDRCAVDIIRPDIQKSGGLLEARKIAGMAHAYYVPMAPHYVVSPIGTMASCHLGATILSFLVLEWHWIQNLALWKNFVREGDIFEKGWIPATNRPGIGPEMNEEAVRKVQMPNTSWFS